jgi:hypothetical protein
VVPRGDGERTLRLPQPADLYDALSGEGLAAGVESYAFVARNGETRIFRQERPEPRVPETRAPMEDSR